MKCKRKIRKFKVFSEIFQKNLHFDGLSAIMYIWQEEDSVVIIDPCVSKDALLYLRERNINCILVILTHEHYDHISGVNWLKENFAKVSVLCSQLCAGALDNPYRNLSEFWEVLFIGKEEKIQEHIRNMDIQPYSCEADETFEGEYEFIWQGHKIFLKETPGHSKGSICILVDEKILFSGDTLVTGHETILRLPGGSKKDFAGITLPYLESLDREIMVYPGHGEPQKLAEFMK